MIALYKKEINRFFSEFSGPSFVMIFLLINGLFLWVLNTDFNLLNNGYAHLDSLFIFSPFLFLIFIPAISMRLMSEEYKENTIENLLTKPISVQELILAKYFSALTLILLSLVPTLCYVISISMLAQEGSSIDGGGILGSYIGLFLLAAVMLSISLFSSCLFKNQISAFVLGILLCSLFYLGLDTIAQIFNSGRIELFISYLGINHHYNSLSKGVMDSRSIVYFLSIISLFILASIQYVKSKRWM